MFAPAAMLAVAAAHSHSPPHAVSGIVDTSNFTPSMTGLSKISIVVGAMEQK